MSSLYHTCSLPNHEDECLNLVCIDTLCQERGLICAQCVQTHPQHKLVSMKKFLLEYKEQTKKWNPKQVNNELDELNLQLDQMITTLFEGRKLIDGIFDGLQKSLSMAKTSLKTMGESQKETQILAIISQWEKSENIKQDFQLLLSYIDNFKPLNEYTFVVKSQTRSIDNFDVRLRNAKVCSQQFQSFMNTLSESIGSQKDSLINAVEQLFKESSQPPEVTKPNNDFEKFKSAQKFTSVQPHNLEPETRQKEQKPIQVIESDEEQRCTARKGLQLLGQLEKQNFMRKNNIAIQGPLNGAAKTTKADSLIMNPKNPPVGQNADLSISQLLSSTSKSTKPHEPQLQQPLQPLQPLQTLQPPQPLQPIQPSQPQQVSTSAQRQNPPINLEPPDNHENDPQQLSQEINLNKKDDIKLGSQPFIKFVSVDDNHIAAFSQSGKIAIYSFKTKRVENILPNQLQISDIAYSQKHNQLFVVTRNGHLEILVKESIENEMKYTPQLNLLADTKPGNIFVVDNEAERSVFVLGESKIVKAFSTRSGRETATFEGLNESPSVLAFDKQKNMIFAGGQKTIVIFDVKTKKQRKVISLEARLQNILLDDQDYLFVTDTKTQIYTAEKLEKKEHVIQYSGPLVGSAWYSQYQLLFVAQQHQVEIYHQADGFMERLQATDILYVGIIQRNGEPQILITTRNGMMNHYAMSSGGDSE